MWDWLRRLWYGDRCTECGQKADVRGTIAVEGRHRLLHTCCPSRFHDRAPKRAQSYANPQNRAH